MVPCTLRDSITLTSETYLTAIESDINIWARTLQSGPHAPFTPWELKAYQGKCESYDVVMESCDSGVAVLSCIQFFENDLIPLYHISDLTMMRKKIYFNILNGEFPAV